MEDNQKILQELKSINNKLMFFVIMTLVSIIAALIAINEASRVIESIKATTPPF